MKIDETDIQAHVRTMQTIVGALAAGVIFFGVLTVTVLRDANGAAALAADEPKILGLPLLTAMTVAVGAISLIASFVVPKVMVGNGLRMIAGGSALDETTPANADGRRVFPAGDAGRLLQLFTSQLIVASATNEGGVFFALLTYMIEGRPIALAIAGGLVAVLLSRFPTADRVAGWLELHHERLAELRREGFSTGP